MATNQSNRTKTLSKHKHKLCLSGLEVANRFNLLFTFIIIIERKYKLHVLYSLEFYDCKWEQLELVTPLSEILAQVL